MTGKEQLRQLINSQYQKEKDRLYLALKVLNFVRKWEGKKLGKRFKEAINAEVPLSKSDGMNQPRWIIETTGGDSWASKWLKPWPQGDGCFSLYLGGGFSGVGDCPTADKLTELNPSHFEAAAKRNAYRLELMNDSKRLGEITKAIDTYRKASEKLEEITDDIDNPDRYDIEKLAGIRN